MALPRKAGNDAGRGVHKRGCVLNSQGLALAKVTVGGVGRAGPPTLSQPYPGHLTHPLPSCRGATSVVYSCEEKGTGTPYAAKILKKTVSVGGGGVSAPLPKHLGTGTDRELSAGHRSHRSGGLGCTKALGFGLGVQQAGGGYWVRFAAAEEMGPGTDVGTGREQWRGVSAWRGARRRPGSTDNTASAWSLLSRSTKRS